MRCEDYERDAGRDMGKEELEFWCTARERDHQDNVVLSHCQQNYVSMMKHGVDIPA